MPSRAADILPPPDPRVVVSIASLLVELPTDRIGFHLSKVLDQIYAGIVEKGWPHPDAVRYARQFGLGVAEAIRDGVLSRPSPPGKGTLQ